MPREDGLPPGTLIMLILRVLAAGPLHGYAIAQRIHPVARGVERRGGLALSGAAEAAAQGLGQGRRRPFRKRGRAVREYRLTPGGRKQLELERANYQRVRRRSARSSTRMSGRMESVILVSGSGALWYLLNRRRLEAALQQEMDAHRAMMGDPRAVRQHAAASRTSPATSGAGPGSTPWSATSDSPCADLRVRRCSHSSPIVSLALGFALTA